MAIKHVRATLLFILLLTLRRVTVGAITSETSSITSIECFGGTLSPACASGNQIAISSYHDGFKPSSDGCPLDGTATGTCCTYDVSADCLQENPTESRYADAFSGMSDGTLSTSSVAPTSGGTCESMTYSPASVFSRLIYLCIPTTRTQDMCVTNTVTVSGLPVYIQNRDYASGNSIVSSDTSCDCSVEASATSSSMKLYVMHEDLYDTPGNCLQSLTIADESGSALKTIQCAIPTYNTISQETISTTYLRISQTNSHTSNAGRFWIGFEGSTAGTDMYVSCPSASRIDCGSLTNPVHGTVSVSCTGFGCTATYTCTNSLISGDLTRTCQSDGTWTGTAATCAASCSTDADCSGGSVCQGGTCTGQETRGSSSGSLSEGAIAGIVIGCLVFVLIGVVGFCIYKHYCANKSRCAIPLGNQNAAEPHIEVENIGDSSNILPDIYPPTSNSRR